MSEIGTIGQRRYKRVHFRGDIGQANRILGAKIFWPNLECSDVYDLSFKGFAVTKPALVDLQADTLYSVKVELGELPAFSVPVRVVWIKEQLIGLESGDISTEAHLCLNQFMNDKLIGQYLLRVDKQFFSAGSTFDYWYQGPNSTHLFVWCDKEDPTKVTKLSLELDDDQWEFENRRVTKGDQFNPRAIQVLGQILTSDFRLKDVIEKVAATE
jgi:hypothetical protein